MSSRSGDTFWSELKFFLPSSFYVYIFIQELTGNGFLSRISLMEYPGLLKKYSLNLIFHQNVV
jgi:hypothetical protein